MVLSIVRRPHGVAGWLPRLRPLFLNSAGRSGESSNRLAERHHLGFTPDQVFDVVADVGKYSLFVPFCSRSLVTKRIAEGKFEADLTIEFFKVKESYTSLVTLERPGHIHAAAVRSKLFRHLASDWKFSPGPTPHSCVLDFAIDFSVSSPMYGPIIDHVLPEISAQQVRAFKDRCARLYGHPHAVQTEPPL